MVVFLAVAHLVTAPIPPFFLVYMCARACLTVSFFFLSSSSTLPLSWSMPGSEVITTEPLHRSLMWCATQMRAHTCTRAHTHACRHTKVKSRQTALTLRALCLNLLSQSADSQKRKNKALMCSHVCHMHISRF